MFYGWESANVGKIQEELRCLNNQAFDQTGFRSVKVLKTSQITLQTPNTGCLIQIMFQSHKEKKRLSVFCILLYWCQRDTPSRSIIAVRSPFLPFVYVNYLISFVTPDGI